MFVVSYGLQHFRNRCIFRNFNTSLENIRTLVVGIDKGLESYRKIFELAHPTL